MLFIPATNLFSYSVSKYLCILNWATSQTSTRVCVVSIVRGLEHSQNDSRLVSLFNSMKIKRKTNKKVSSNILFLIIL